MTELARYVDGGAGPAVVLLHEGAGAAAVWDATRAALAGTGRRLVAYDRRGYGASPRDASFGPDHFDQAVEDLAGLVRQLGGEPVDLVGHSDGGSIALLAAARRAAPIRSVTVVDTHVFADPQTVAGVQAMGRPADWDDRTRAHYESLHGPDWEQVVQAWLTMWTTPGGVLDWDIRVELADIASPVLVVHDRGDRLSPEVHAQAILDAAPSATVSWYDDGSHRPHRRQPERFVSDVQQFWDSVATSRTHVT